MNVIQYMPRLLNKFLAIISAHDAEQTPLGKKGLEQLRYFLEDLRDASYRTLQLDSQVIARLTEFLMRCDESRQRAIVCSLDWLNHFIDFFREDFLAVLERARARQGAKEHVSGHDSGPLVGGGGGLQLQEEYKGRTNTMGEGLIMINTGSNSAAPGNSLANSQEDIRLNKAQYLDDVTNLLLRKMYKEQFPDIISTILRLKHSRKIIDNDCKRLVENINGRFLRTVIQILRERDEFEFIFKRLKKEYDDTQKISVEKQEAIIQWYTELFKDFGENLLEQHEDIFQGLIINLNFGNARLVKRIMVLVCMMSTKNGDYSRKVMSQLIDRFHFIRFEPKFDDKIKQVI